MCVCIMYIYGIHIYKEIYYKVLAYAVMEAEKSRDLPSAS